jgi:hypothetical protein
MREKLFRCKVNVFVLLILAAAAFTSPSQQLIDEDFTTYLEYSSSLFSEYMDASESYLNEYMEKSGRNIDEWMETTKPFMERWINDPDYTYEDYLADTRKYYEKMRRKNSEYSKEYNERTRPISNAYREASAALMQSYYAGGEGIITQSEFDRLMRDFRSRVQDDLKDAAPSDTAPPPPVPGNTAIVRRMNRYSANTGFYSRELLNMYASADADGSGDLTYFELEQFQRRLGMNYDYILNNTALTPEEFLSRGGGDCEDWAIVTAGLLRFWDVPAFVGVLEQPDGNIGHAVCLIKVDRPKEGYIYWEVTGTYNLNGLYIPVDYERVGKLSSSLFTDWHLTDIFTPEDIYGNWM